MEEIVKTGKYYRIFSMKVNGIKYYFVGSIENGGFMWVNRSIINAIEKFEFAEDIAQTIARNENWED